MDEETKKVGEIGGDNMAEMLGQLSKEISRRGDPVLLEEIEYPIEVQSVKVREGSGMDTIKVGTPVRVRPCFETTGHKPKTTYDGVFLGEMPCGMTSAYWPKIKELTVVSSCNPAMYVPALKRVVWGMESFWSRVDKETKDKDITDEDISNTPYVKALKK